MSMMAIGTDAPVWFAVIVAITKSSPYAASGAREVFFVRLRYWLIIGGSTMRSACGKTTSENVWPRREAERQRGLALALGDGLDAAPHDLADEGRGVDDEREEQREVVDGEAHPPLVAGDGDVDPTGTRGPAGGARRRPRAVRPRPRRRRAPHRTPRRRRRPGSRGRRRLGLGRDGGARRAERRRADLAVAVGHDRALVAAHRHHEFHAAVAGPVAGRPPRRACRRHRRRGRRRRRLDSGTRRSGWRSPPRPQRRRRRSRPRPRSTSRSRTAGSGRWRGRPGGTR
jgi:hypothetical protein